MGGLTNFIETVKSGYTGRQSQKIDPLLSEYPGLGGGGTITYSAATSHANTSFGFLVPSGKIFHAKHFYAWTENSGLCYLYDGPGLSALRGVFYIGSTSGKVLDENNLVGYLFQSTPRVSFQESVLYARLGGHIRDYGDG